MKTASLFKTAAALALTLGLAACLNSGKEDEHAEAHHLFVVMRDSSGALVAADTVHWSYAGDGAHAKVAHSPVTDSVQRGATRKAVDGSVWDIPDHVHGSLYLRASRNVPHPTEAICRLVGYTVAHFNADTLSDTVSLTLNVQRVCPTEFPE